MLSPTVQFKTIVTGQPGMPLVAQVVMLAGLWRQEYAHLREGQSLFNALYDLAPDLADGIRGADLDPFYLDGRVEGFLAWLAVQQQSLDK